ncbi:MAG TPA: hypothetical protein VFR37_17760 [Longimicrobium sp.]|nr:hypothetical protein [Longimicrobium sp.]
MPSDDQRLDELIATISIPADSRIPDPGTGKSTTEEYDLYFRLERVPPDLADWTRTFLATTEMQLADLPHSSLPPRDLYELIRGLLVISRLTLESWVRAHDAAGGEPQ